MIGAGNERQRDTIGYSNWRTPTHPKSILAALKDEVRFTFDAAASHANTKFLRYCTVDGKYEREPPCPTLCGAVEFPFCAKEGHCNGWQYKKLSDTSGLDPENWRGETVFCNPPYTADTIKDWIELANEAPHDYAYLLLPPSTDTVWFHNLWPTKTVGLLSSHETKQYHAIIFPTGKQRREIRFYRGRERFERPASRLEMWDEGSVEYEWDESDPKSVPGEQPRAGNIVYVVRNKFQTGLG